MAHMAGNYSESCHIAMSHGTHINESWRICQVIQLLYEHAPDARAFIVAQQLDAVLQRVVEEDESTLVQVCLILNMYVCIKMYSYIYM